MTTLRPALATFTLSALLFTQLAQAAPQQQSPANTIEASPEANVATRLRSAHTLYIVDLGADANFPASHEQAYTQFVDNMKQWGQYQLSASPDASDIVLQLHAGVAVPGSPQQSPYLKLTFADPKTLAPLWVITVPVHTGMHGTTDLFAQSMQAATTQVKMLAGAPVSHEEEKQAAIVSTPTAAPQHHYGGWIGIGSIIAVAVVAPIAFHALYAHSVSDAKEHQDEFCREHNIPPSECAGG